MLACYHSGLFQRPVVKDISNDVEAWEKENKDTIMRLAALIKLIISLVRELGGNATLNYNARTDKLIFRKLDKAEMLPDDLYEKWTSTSTCKVSSKRHPATPETVVQ